MNIATAGVTTGTALATDILNVISGLLRDNAICGDKLTGHALEKAARAGAKKTGNLEFVAPLIALHRSLRSRRPASTAGGDWLSLLIDEAVELSIRLDKRCLPQTTRRRLRRELKDVYHVLAVAARQGFN